MRKEKCPISTVLCVGCGTDVTKKKLLIAEILTVIALTKLLIYGKTSSPVADPEFSKGGFQDSAREARGEKLVRSRPLPVQTGGKNEELKMISVFL